MTEFEARQKMRLLQKPVDGKLRSDPKLKRHPIYQGLVGKNLQIFGVTPDPKNGPLLWFRPKDDRLKGVEMSLLLKFFDLKMPLPIDML